MPFPEKTCGRRGSLSPAANIVELNLVSEDLLQKPYLRKTYQREIVSSSR
jgi:hypothetical protein